MNSEPIFLIPMCWIGWAIVILHQYLHPASFCRAQHWRWKLEFHIGRRGCWFPQHVQVQDWSSVPLQPLVDWFLWLQAEIFHCWYMVTIWLWCYGYLCINCCNVFYFWSIRRKWVWFQCMLEVSCLDGIASGKVACQADRRVVGAWMKRPPTRPPTINDTGHQRHPTARMINFTSILNLRFLIFWFKTENHDFCRQKFIHEAGRSVGSRTGGHGPCHPQRPSGSWRSNQRRPGAGSRSRFCWRSCFVCFQRENNPHNKMLRSGRTAKPHREVIFFEWCWMAVWQSATEFYHRCLIWGKLTIYFSMEAWFQLGTSAVSCFTASGLIEVHGHKNAWCIGGIEGWLPRQRTKALMMSGARWKMKELYPTNSTTSHISMTLLGQAHSTQ